MSVNNNNNNDNYSIINLMYQCLREDNPKVAEMKFRRIRVPHSDVFYAFFLCRQKFPERMKDMDIYTFEDTYFTSDGKIA